MSKGNKPRTRVLLGAGRPGAVDDPLSSGPVRSVQRVLKLIDTSDPAWPDIAGALQEFKAAGIDLDETATAMAVKLGRQRWTEADTPGRGGFTQLSLTVGADSIVYYIRRGCVIKIGTTADPRQRFSDLLPDEILAFEPGGREAEKARHGQFRHLRGKGEHFRDAPELRDHIAAVRSAYGDPDPSWPTASASGEHYRGWRMPRSSSVDVLTALQAEAQLGIKRVTVRRWTHIKRIQPVGREGAHGAYLFRRDQLVSLRDSSAERMVSGL